MKIIVKNLAIWRFIGFILLVSCRVVGLDVPVWAHMRCLITLVWVDFTGMSGWIVSLWKMAKV